MQKPNYIPLVILLVISIVAVLMPAVPTQIVTEGINSGDTAWMLVATALVLLMTPGLAYFYGGMVNNKNVISTMLQSFVAMGVISILWVVVGFSLAFGSSIGGFVGNPMDHFMFKGVLDGKPWSLAANDSVGGVCFLPVEICGYHTCPGNGFDGRADQLPVVRSVHDSV